MCEGLSRLYDEFINEFMDLFCEMADDPVVNVRISLAKVVKNLSDNNSKLMQHQKIKEVFEKLIDDPSIDVRGYLEPLVKKNSERNILSADHQVGYSDILPSQTTTNDKPQPPNQINVEVNKDRVQDYFTEQESPGQSPVNANNNDKGLERMYTPDEADLLGT